MRIKSNQGFSDRKKSCQIRKISLYAQTFQLAPRAWHQLTVRLELGFVDLWRTSGFCYVVSLWQSSKLPYVIANRIYYRYPKIQNASKLRFRV